MGYNLTEVVNTTPIPVLIKNNALSPFNLSKEFNLTPNYPIDAAKNPWWFRVRLRHKGFGSVCVGRNNELFLITRVSQGHGYGGGNLYWSVSYDEGETWSNPVQFSLDSAPNGTEDLRDVTLTYDNMSDRYLLVYVHQYDIRQDSSGNYTDYSYYYGELKVWIGYEPFGLNNTTMYDISPNVVPTGNVGQQPWSRLTQTFSPLSRLGRYMYLPCYGLDWGEGESPASHSQHDGNYGTALLRIDINDNTPLSDVYMYNNWELVKKWEGNGDNEVTMFVTYDSENDKSVINLLSRAGNDTAYITSSSDFGTTWTQKESLGFDAAGGPMVFRINDIYMLFAREQNAGGNNATTYVMFSKDGHTWNKRMFVSDTATAYGSIAQMGSGKVLLCYSKEVGNMGIQVMRSINSLPV